MQAAIFVEGILIIGLLIFLLLRKRISIVPNSDWAVISEAFTKDVWNQTLELENRFQQNPLAGLHDDDSDSAHLRAAFQQSAQIAATIGDGIRQQSFYGTPLALETYCSHAAQWYFDIARHYEAWALAIEHEQQTSDISMSTVKGAVRGLLGGWTEVLSMFAEQSDTPTDTPEARRVDALQSDQERLNYARAYLNSERASVQGYLEAMFGWQFD